MVDNPLGHESGCDCAVCDDIAFRKSLQKGFMSIAEVHEHEKLLRDELDDALGKIAWLQVDLHQTVMDCERYKEALESIRDFGKDSPIITTWPDAFSRLVEIAREALPKA